MVPLVELIYGLRPAVLFQASVHILRKNIPSAKEIVSGTLTEYPAVEELLGVSDTDVDNTVLSWFSGKNTFVPENIDHFFERSFLQLNLNCPEMLTYSGFLEQAGIKNHNGYLQQSPSEEHERWLKSSNNYLLTALNDTQRWQNITPSQAISHNILKWMVENSNRTFRDQVYAIEQLDGAHALFLILMSDLAIVEDLNDIQLYEARLLQCKMKFELYVADIKRKRKLGVMPPKKCLEKIARSITDSLANFKNYEENMMLISVKSKYTAATKEDVPEKMTNSLKAAIESSVIPGYQSLLDEINCCIETASDDAGVWKLPDGDAFYSHCLKWETTTDYTPEQIHQMGLDCTKELLENFQKVVKGLNDRGDMTLDASKPVERNLKILSEDDKFLYQDTEADHAACIQEYKRLLGLISEKVKGMFNIVPKSQCQIKPMPKPMGEGGAGAFYFQGSLDLSRPGIFFANLTNIKSQNKTQMKTLTAHEAVPGHHFQCSLQLENTDLPYFRRCMECFTAYLEGWGLYAEHIGKEVGFYNSPDGHEGYDVLGYYCAELLRSSRLVVDTGLHKMRWSRQQAIDYMIKNTGMSVEEGEGEVDRYCVLPGQACAYKIGQLKLLEIRGKLQSRPGFDMAVFHDKVLAMGVVPLGILEEEMLK